MTAPVEPGNLQARWEARFPLPATREPLPPGFSPWAAREKALKDLRALPALAERIRCAYRAFRQAQARSVRAARGQQSRHLEEARERFFEACVLVQPVVAARVPSAWTPGLWDEVRLVVTRLCETGTPPASKGPAASPGLFG